MGFNKKNESKIQDYPAPNVKYSTFSIHFRERIGESGLSSPIGFQISFIGAQVPSMGWTDYCLTCLTSIVFLNISIEYYRLHSY